MVIPQLLRQIRPVCYDPCTDVCFPFTGPDDAAFLPDQVDGLVGWYQSYNAPSLVFVGQNISQWSDISGNDNHMTQTVDADRYVLNPAGSGFNNLPVLAFNGNRARHYLLPDNIITAGSAPRAMFMMGRSLQRGTGGGGAINFGPDGALTRFSLNKDPNNDLLAVDTGAGARYTTSLNWNEYAIVGCVLRGTTLGDATVYYNDQSEQCVGAGVINTGTTFNAMSRLIPGQINGIEQIGEVLLYDSAPSEAEVTQIINYLNGVWAAF